MTFAVLENLEGLSILTDLESAFFYLRFMRKYFNLAGTYLPTLQQCVRERLWIHTSRRWHGPYDWAWKFGVTYFGLDWQPKVADPYELISKARAAVLTETQAAALEKFQKRVDDYYRAGKDQLLLKSIETGLWQFPE